MRLSKEEKTKLKEQIQEAADASFKGWDFSYADQYGGKPEFPLPWDYKESVIKYIKNSRSMLDMGTGGGEFLASLDHYPEKVTATESYVPNIEVAQKRFKPFGIEVIGIEEGMQENYILPFEDNTFDLIINRHEDYDSKELFRIIKPNGIFITQQVGIRDLEKLKTIFGILTTDNQTFEWKMEIAEEYLRKAGFEIIEKNESIAFCRFYDIRSIIYYLKVLQWNFAGFDIDKDYKRLENLYILIKRDGYFQDICHRFFIIVRKKKWADVSTRGTSTGERASRSVVRNREEERW